MNQAVIVSAQNLMQSTHGLYLKEYLRLFIAYLQQDCVLDAHLYAFLQQAAAQHEDLSLWELIDCSSGGLTLRHGKEIFCFTGKIPHHAPS